MLPGVTTELGRSFSVFQSSKPWPLVSTYCCLPDPNFGIENRLGSQVDGNHENWQQFLFPVPVKLEEKSDANDFEVLFVLVASKS